MKNISSKANIILIEIVLKYLHKCLFCSQIEVDSEYAICLSYNRAKTTHDYNTSA